MKNLFLTAITVIGFAFTAQAQNSGNVTLNVKLHPIQTLIVNPSQNTVNLNYHTTTDYANGVSSAQADHLTVYSTGGFTVKVESASDAISSAMATNSNTLAANSIQVAANAGSEALGGATYSEVNLSTAGGTLISSNTGGVNKKFNVEYKGAEADQYVNLYYNGENPTIYTTTVTYTISAQ